MLKTPSVTTRVGQARSRFLSSFFEVLDVVVLKHAQSGFGQTAGFDEAGVAVAVGQDETVLVDERRDKPQVRGVARAEGQGGFDLFELGQVAFQLVVGRHGAGNETCGPGPDAPLLDRFDGRPVGRGMIGQPEIIVRGHGDEPAAFDGNGRIRRGLHDLELPAQVSGFQIV